jgi:hypothetical protein
MLEVVPYELDEIKNELKRKAIEEFGIKDAEYEGSNVSQLINLLAYSTVINNTNFTFGLNEMFISQAQDRRNVIKHARQMGYSHKRRISFQYKIKLKVLTSGAVTLSKYANFSSNGNNYVYFGDNISDIYGTYAYLNMLNNENNNAMANVYGTNSLIPGKYIVSEEGLIAKVLDKEPVGDPRILLEILDNSELPIQSQIGKAIYVPLKKEDGTTSRTVGYRDMVQVGIIDTFVTDNSTKTFRIQMTVNNDITFPLATSTEHTPLNEDGTEANTILELSDTNDYFKMSIPSKYPINAVEEIILSKFGEDNIEISTLSLIYRDGIDTKNNIAIPSTNITADESHNTANVQADNSAIVTLLNNPIGDIGNTLIEKDGFKYLLTVNDITANNKEITIPSQNQDITNSNIGINVIEEDSNKGLIFLPHPTATIVTTVTVKDAEGNKTNIDNNLFSYDEAGTKVQLLEYDEENDVYVKTSAYDDGYTAEVAYNYIVDLSDADIQITYSYVEDISGYSIALKYNYIYDDEGYINTRFFFSDLRGVKNANENDYAPTKADSWSGFYASNYNAETNVLYFDISNLSDDDKALPLTSTIKKRTSGQNFHNAYVSINNNTPEIINKVLSTPFKDSRFSFTEPILDPVTSEITGFTPYNESTCFASINKTSVKNEIEIIVKEGVISRWNEETEASIESRKLATEQNLELPKPVYLNPHLAVAMNSDMVEAGHFTIQNDDIENDGIELFITRVLEDGSIEYEKPWVRRDFLLAEETDTGLQSFVAMSDVDYEDYINIYTRYAGTGTPLSIDMTAKMNILTSKGPEGNTNTLIAPVDNPDFEAKYFTEETLTPVITYIEGTEIEDTESIKETAPKFSNTANRAVTKNDYKTICEAQQFVQSAQIWGGEEETPKAIPGTIFFSIIPYSRPITYAKVNTKYSLKHIQEPELFYPSHFQITGKETYASARKDNPSVLFNLLDNYKIITLQLEYNKAIYIDYKITTKILKYAFGQTVDETNADVFTATKKYMVKEIEKFDATFYKSSLNRYIDETLGDDYGIELSVAFSVDLFDNLVYPDSGTFFNVTKKDLLANTTGPDEYKNIIGDDDEWKFSMPLDFPISDLYEDSLMENNIIVKPGRLITSNITNCNTEAFVRPTDMLYMELDDGTFVSLDSDNKVEEVLANNYSTSVEISIIYVRNAGAAKFNDTALLANSDYRVDSEQTILDKQRFKVGSYFIHKEQKIIRLELNTHTHWHIDSQAVVTQEMIDLNYRKDNEGNGNTGSLFVPFTDTDTDNDLGALIYYKVNPTNDEYIYETDADGAYVLLNPDLKLSDGSDDTSISNRKKIMTLNITEDEAGYSNKEMPWTDTINDKSVLGNRGEAGALKVTEGVELYKIKKCALPREYFTTGTRTMNINPKGENIKLRRNVFSRFKSIEFL